MLERAKNYPFNFAEAGYNRSVGQTTATAQTASETVQTAPVINQSSPLTLKQEFYRHA
jgi:hypothetical protein